MKIYEVTLKGYKPDSDTTDHLVKWVKAYSLMDVERFVERNKLDCVDDITIMNRPNAAKYDYEDGVDLELDPRGMVIDGKTCYLNWPAQSRQALQKESSSG